MTDCRDCIHYDQDEWGCLVTDNNLNEWINKNCKPCADYEEIEQDWSDYYIDMEIDKRREG